MIASKDISRVNKIVPSFRWLSIISQGEIFSLIFLPEETRPHRIQTTKTNPTILESPGASANSLGRSWCVHAFRVRVIPRVREPGDAGLLWARYAESARRSLPRSSFHHETARRATHAASKGARAPTKRHRVLQAAS